MDLTKGVAPPRPATALLSPQLAERASQAVARYLLAPTCVLLLTALYGLTLASAFCRYALNAPLGWVDEVAAILLIWLATLGAALATQRNQHMRLTSVIDHVSPRVGAFLTTLGGVLSTCLFASLVPAAIAYAHSEWAIASPLLGLPDGLRGIGIAAGAVLLTFFSLTQLWSQSKAKDILTAVAVVAALGGIAWQSGALFSGLGNYNLIIYLVVGVSACAAVGVPIGYSFGLGALSYVVFTTPFSAEVVVGRVDEGMGHLVLLAIPLFIVLGAVMELSGVARALVRFLCVLFGGVKGGLNYVLIGAMFLVSGISGSKAADMAAVAPALLPEMKKRGASAHDLVALLAATGAQTETIPPSFALIVLGSVTGVSIGALFTGGILPALVAGLVLAGVCAFKERRLRRGSGQTKASAKTVLASFVHALPALVLPFLVRAFVVEGVTTATEAATIAVAYCAAVGLLIYRNGAWNRLYERLVETASLTGAILLILGTATAVAWALAQSGFSTQVAEILGRAPAGRYGFLIASIFVFVGLGALLEGIPAIILFGPLLFPVATTFGINEVQYAMVAVLSMGLGLFSPPFGIGFYAACAIGQVSPDKVMQAIWPYLIGLFTVVILVAAVPWLSTGFLQPAR